MACSGNSSTCCQSGCYKNEDQLEDTTTRTTLASPQATEEARDGDDKQNQQNLCVKCKANQPIAAATGSASSYGPAGDESRFCRECFRSNMYGKFRLAVTSHAMITPTDNVLVAFSGGPASRVALQFVHEMQQRAQKNFDASKDRSLPVFGVGVVFIDENSAHCFPSDKVDEAIQEMRLMVSNLAPMKQFHVVPIENIYASNSTDGKEQLVNLLDTVNDATGKEDLLLHLRMLTLQKVASDAGYNRLILGSCTSRIACHVFPHFVEHDGAVNCLIPGYSLSADIQYVDARWEIPVVLPVRDCTSKELNLLCHLDGLKTVQLLDNPPSGINGLVSSFVTLLQEENPSRECTIVRTAGKLTPFHFNRIPEINDSNVPLATRRRQKRYSLKPKESISSESFCPICNSPLDNSDLPSLSNLESCQSSSFGATCCSSCRFQILPKDPRSMEHFYSLLPQKVVTQAKHKINGNFSLLREQIQDCLLSDSEDEAKVQA